MLEGQVDGYFIIGQNPAVGSANARQQRPAMAKLKWLVVRDLNMIESATWWKDGPEIASGELKTEEIGTEVFFLPAATHVEKSGSFTQTQRMVQWRHQAVSPPETHRANWTSTTIWAYGSGRDWLIRTIRVIGRSWKYDLGLSSERPR